MTNTTTKIGYNISGDECLAAIKEVLNYNERGIGHVLKLTLSHSGEVGISVRRYTDGTPAREWHNQDLAYTIVSESYNALEEFVNSERVAQLLQTIYDGHDTKWNGQNHVGTFDEDAKEAHEELERLCEQHQFSALEAKWAEYEYIERAAEEAQRAKENE